MSKPRLIADFPNKADDYDEAAEKSHDQNTDTALDEGGDNEVTAEDIRDHVDSTENPHQVTAGQVGAYTKAEADGLLDDKFDKSGGDIEGVTRIVTPSASALVVERTGNNAQSVRLRITGTGLSGEAPEATIDSLPEDDDIPLYVPGRISTGTGFYIGSTRKDQEWDEKADQSALDATNQAISDLFTAPVIPDIEFNTEGIVTEIVTPQFVQRMGSLVRVNFDIRVIDNNANPVESARLSIPIPQFATMLVGNGLALSSTYGYKTLSFRQWGGSPPGEALIYYDGLTGFMEAGDDIMTPGVRYAGVMELYITP